MKYLVIDSSNGTLVALVEKKSGQDGLNLVRQETNASSRDHVENLTPMMASVLQEDKSGVEAVIVGTGPAPFTGLRAGIMSAKMFAHVMEIPCYGICVLDVWARMESEYLARTCAPGVKVPLLVVTDARRKEIYFALYEFCDGVLTRIREPDVAKPEAIVALLRDLAAVSCRIAGPGAQIYADVLQQLPGSVFSEEKVDFLDAGLMVQMVAELKDDAGKQSELSLAPRYLRRPDVYAGLNR